jgi:hypothetical protein
VTIFYLGTHQPGWLGREEIDARKFVSRRTLCKRVSLPRAHHDWCLDSGGFSELSMHGRWTIGPEQYVSEVRRWSEGIGRLQWAAIQDWMCEPWIIRGGKGAPGTGLSVEEHQRRTVQSAVTLRRLAPDIPWCCVLQGWRLEDYDRCADMYASAGIDLSKESVVGIGSVCRRQATDEIYRIFKYLHDNGLTRNHGFGVKKGGLEKGARFIHSADSLAWSMMARFMPPMPGCTHKNCANCWRFAIQWYHQMLDAIERGLRAPIQGELF